MSVPTLRSLANVPTLAAQPQGDRANHPFGEAPLDQDQQGFVVQEDGDFAGRSWRAGDVVICQPQRDAFLTVLIPTGRGVPRFGRIGRDGLTGCHGEPCSTRRFRSAGQVVGGLRQQGSGWVSVPCNWHQAAVEQPGVDQSDAARTERGQSTGDNRPHAHNPSPSTAGQPAKSSARPQRQGQRTKRSTTYQRQTRPSLGSTKQTAVSFREMIAATEQQPTHNKTHHVPTGARPPQLTLFASVG